MVLPKGIPDSVLSNLFSEFHSFVRSVVLTRLEVFRFLESTPSLGKTL